MQICYFKLLFKKIKIMKHFHERLFIINTHFCMQFLNEKINLEANFNMLLKNLYSYTYYFTLHNFCVLSISNSDGLGSLDAIFFGFEWTRISNRIHRIKLSSVVLSVARENFLSWCLSSVSQMWVMLKTKNVFIFKRHRSNEI